jgi:hypothetical protein
MKSNSGAVVDALGDIRARIAALEREEEKLRDQVVEYGPGEHLGSRWAAVVGTWRRSRVDVKTLRTRYPGIAQECSVAQTTACVRVRAEISEDA